MTEDQIKATDPSVNDIRAEHRTKIQALNAKRLAAHRQQLQEVADLFGRLGPDHDLPLKYPDHADPFLSVFLMCEEDMREHVEACMHPTFCDHFCLL